MSVKKSLLLFILSIPLFLLYAEEKKEESRQENISEDLDHLIGKNLESLGLPLDINLIAESIKEAYLDRNIRVSESDCLEKMEQLRQVELEKKAESNVARAEDFLKKNGLQPKLLQLHQGKVQVEILRKGKGDKVLSYSTPLLKYRGSTQDGRLICASENEGELMNLSETVQGFQEGVLGMVEGEKRRIYIHPDYGYGRNHPDFPGELLIFEVEVVQADKQGTSFKSKQQIQKELIAPFFEETHKR